MVYDSAGKKVIMFGGAGGAGNDTWAYDPTANSWTELHPAGDLPSARCAYSMVYDSAHGRVILFGGHHGDATLDDTWSYDPASNTWTELHPAGDVPSARENAHHHLRLGPRQGDPLWRGSKG